MGKKWYFITVSIVLAVVGVIFMAFINGLPPGIEFRGGTSVYVKFAKEPNIGAIRSELDRQGFKGSTVQQYNAASLHEFIIGLNLSATTSAKALDTGRATIVKVLTDLYGSGPAGKLDFNNSSPQVIADHLLASDPLLLASKGSDAATKTYQGLAQGMVNFRNGAGHSGMIGDFKELSAVPGVTAAVENTLASDFYLSGYSIFDTQIVGPKVGSDLRRQALYVTLAGLGAMLVYIWFRFELVYGVAAVIATFHDVIITLGIFSLLNKEITLTVIAALLTLVGYSMNDTIVVFDRIRENVHLGKRENFADLVNRSINQTLSRTILTSGLTFLAVLSLYLFGGEVIHGFALVLVVGVIIGTYSSMAIASPIVLAWQDRITRTGTGKGKAVERSKLKAKSYEREATGARR